MQARAMTMARRRLAQHTFKQAGFKATDRVIWQGVCRAQVADHTKKCNQYLADMFGERIFKMKAVIRDPLLSIRDADLICRYQAAQVRKDRPCRLEAEKTSGPARRGACQENRLAAKRAL